MSDRQVERERDEARAGADDTPCDPNAVPTPGQWVAAFLDGDAERRLAMARRAIADADVAGRCFVENHRRRLRQQ